MRMQLPSGLSKNPHSPFGSNSRNILNVAFQIRTMQSKKEYIQSLQQDEEFHSQVYGILEKEEKNSEIRKTLSHLYIIERGHSEILKKLLRMNGFGVRKRNNFFRILLIMISRKLFGIAFTIKLMEYNKLITDKKLSLAMRRFKFGRGEAALLHLMEKGERTEDVLSHILLSLSPVLNNIRDVVFGMNDGLVEVLAAVVGFSAALRLPVLVLIAGMLVAISGTLSMSGGAYLSTKYEKNISASGRGRKPGLSALYTGIFYFCGAAFPIAPFALGIGGLYGIAYSVLLTSLVLATTSSIIAILSGQSIAKRVAESLLISLGAASVTILLGFYARYVLHITV
ncbi:MAG: VIT1/CCC1 transporter family protein [Candidatus Micrarchaeia archaeon]